MSAAAFVVMGVSGCGKSTVGRALAERLNLTFRDGDALHPAANIAKMAQGEALTDADREPWLRAVGAELRPGIVMACSALRRSYRDILREIALAQVVFLYLEGRRDLLIGRMLERKGHFMPAALLDSQLATLEEPDLDELHYRVGIERPVAGIADEIVALLQGT